MVKVVIEVVATLRWDRDKFLICQRPVNKARGLLWEFVGGKVENGETKEQALIRECQEELAISVEPHEVFTEVTHEYPDIIVHLTLLHCAILWGQPQLLEHNVVTWITANEIPNYNFCPADVVIFPRSSYARIATGRCAHSDDAHLRIRATLLRRGYCDYGHEGIICVTA